MFFVLETLKRKIQMEELDSDMIVNMYNNT